MAENRPPRREGVRQEASGFVEDLKGAPDEVRRTVRDVDDKLAQTARDKPAFDKALDYRVALMALGIAFAVTVVLALLGVRPLFCVLLFVALAAGLWVLLARRAAPRPPNP